MQEIKRVHRRRILWRGGCLILLLGFLWIWSGQRDIPSGMLNPADIDPLDPAAGDFLDIDPGPIRIAAENLAHAGKHLQAARYYLAYLRLNGFDSTAIYNLACCYGQLEQEDLALKYLLRAFKAGFNQYDHFLKDSDFDKVRHAPAFLRWLSRVEEIGRDRGQVIPVRTTLLTEMYLQVPRKGDAGDGFPLLVGLHGNGGNGESLMRGFTSSIKKAPLIVAVPQGAYANFSYLRGSHFSWGIEKRSLWKEGDLVSVESIQTAVNEVKRRHKVSEVYLLGFSQGAAFAFMTALKDPLSYAGVISIGGLFPEMGKEYSIISDREVEKAKSLRVFLAQGTRDDRIPAGTVSGIAGMLRNKGYEVEFNEYEGGHEITPDLMKKVVAWIRNEK